MAQIAPVPNISSLKGETAVREPDRLEGVIGRRAAEIRATVPDLELATDADASAALELSARAGVSITAVLARACATALRQFPWANAAYRDGAFERYRRVNLGIVVATERGLVVPAVLDADTKSLSELSAQITRLSERATSGELTPPEQAGTTFTLADFSALPAHRWTPMITASQAAALTAGAVRPAPVMRGGQVVAGELITLTLACDHRILFGRRAAALLGRITELLERDEP